MINWKMILIGALGLFVGYKLNEIANQKSEKRIIDTLTAEIEKLKEKTQVGKVSSEQQTRIQALEDALQLIKSK